MNGTDYSLSFTTAGLDVEASDLSAQAIADGNSAYNASGVGVREYLNIALSSGGKTATIGLDMVNIDKKDEGTGLPNLCLPSITYNADGTYIYPTVPTTDDDNLTFVGILDDNGHFFTGDSGAAITTDITGNYTLNVADQGVLDSYMPVYQFPGSTPPMYFAAQYDDDTGALKLRSLAFYNGSVDVTSTASNAGLAADLNGGVLDGVTIKANPTVFSYNVKSNMNYTSFKLQGAPTIAVDGNNNVTADVTYHFLAEFDERAVDTGSDLSKTASKLTLWYYGCSNADIANYVAANGDEDTIKGLERMHKLEATVYFNADGTFASVEWADTDNSNAPLGYRIVNGNVPPADPYTGNVGPNFQIAIASSSAASSTKDTLNFMQAQSLDTPGDVSTLGVWSTQGTTYQGAYHATKTTIYDDNGKEHTLEVTFKKLTENRWRWEAFLIERDESGQDVLTNIIPTPNCGEIEFDGSGRISSVIADSTDNQRRGLSDRFPNAEVEITVPFSLNGQPNSTITLNFGGGVGAGGENIDGVTQFASETTTKPVYQNGYTMGVLKNYSIAVDGTITGSYDNGLNIPLYRVALATFANEQGLEKIGNTMFRATVNSGNANIDGATTNGKGSIMAQYLEMSNVDLTEEFTHLIIAQRGFQANTRVVTVSDQILEEVVNLKR
ncbi:MAG: flagellar hook-basal body complex protein [Paludibacteraceae bacterium]|nr:flagellar hook-basal body complex protein [Paludibacteraceae bacterium]